ncbi:MAG: DNA polymerase I [Flavobacteriales bacterium]|nr:DNA polymerase I [Flavobacteriales bacterium]HQV75541.1 DNA polymerase I [Flavobacteriales bacterium]HQW40983.1 DNA polymerase I [Flavobacteriales bacterium]
MATEPTTEFTPTDRIDPTTDKRLFLLDAFALIYRAYFSFIRAPRVNSKGFNTSAAFGFTLTLLDLIKREKPTHIAVVFDTAAPTERHEVLLDYKANREEMPDDIRSNLVYIRRIIEAMNIPILESDGYEADDVIGTLAKKAEIEGYTTFMVTPDKDFGQLVTDKIIMYKPGRGGDPPEKLGPKEICARWGLETTDQVKDILGLMGDAVDNIPGIPGIGEKTAMKLVQEFGSLEGVLENVDKLKGKQKENVIAFAEQGRMSKMLATILIDAPVELDHTALHLDPPDKDRVLEVFSELEFKNLTGRILSNETNGVADVKEKSGVKKTVRAIPGQVDLFGSTVDEEGNMEIKEFANIDTVPHRYFLVEGNESMYMLAAQLKKQPRFCFDTETTGTEERTAELVGLSFSWKAHEGHYVPVPEDRVEAQRIVDIFKPLLENDTIGKIAQNAKYDIRVLAKYGVEVKGPLFDTMVAHYLLKPDQQKHGMDYLSESYLNYRPVSIETLIGPKARGKTQRTMRDAEINAVKEYAAEDADITWQLAEKFAPMLEQDEVTSLFNDVEMPLVSVLADMETEGIRIDIPGLFKFSEELGAEILTLQEKIHAACGVHFNIDSPKQLGDVLFETLKLGGDKVKKTAKTGQYQTSEDILQELSNAHPSVPLILDYRSLRKLKGTYVDTLPEAADPVTHRVHTSYLQTVAATGRLASNDPNLQNIPIRTEKGREIRKAFVPRDKDFQLLSADYSQIELRIIAHMSGDANMQAAFRAGLDIHAATAAKVFNVDIAEVTREQRSKAKAVNFGIAYGQGAFGLAQNLGIPRAEAKEIIDDYFAQFPGVRGYMDEMIGFCRTNGYIKTLMGRRRYLPDITSGNNTVRAQAERIAINAPMQGSAADIIKVAMVDIHSRMRSQGLKSRLLLQVHDELVLDAHNDEAEALKAMVKERMESAYALDVPLVVDISLGKNWLEAH